MTHRRSFRQLMEQSVSQLGRLFPESLPFTLFYRALPALGLYAFVYLAAGDLWGQLARMFDQARGMGPFVLPHLLHNLRSIWYGFLDRIYAPDFDLPLFLLGAVLVGLGLVCLLSLVLRPFLDARLLSLYADGWHGRERRSYLQRFRELDGRRWQAIVAALCREALLRLLSVLLCVLPLAALAALGAFAYPAFELLPAAFAPWALLLLLGVLALLAVSAVETLYFGALQKGAEENRWGFAAMARAFMTLKSRFVQLVAGTALMRLFVLLCCLPCAALDAYLLLFYGLPTPFAILCGAALYPLTHSFFILLYFDRRVEKEGYVYTGPDDPDTDNRKEEHD